MTLHHLMLCVHLAGVIVWVGGMSFAHLCLRPASLALVDDELTTRQVEILTLIAQGKSAKEIAFELGLSPKTVDVHRARIMERLRLNDIASLTRYAVRKGLVKA